MARIGSKFVHHDPLPPTAGLPSKSERLSDVADYDSLPPDSFRAGGTWTTEGVAKGLNRLRGRELVAAAGRTDSAAGRPVLR